MLRYGPVRLAGADGLQRPRQVGATYKALWTKVKKNAEARKRGYTKKRYKGLDQLRPIRLPHDHVQHRRDYSLKHDQQVSIVTLVGGIVVPIRGYHKHVALLHQGATIGAARLWYDRAKKRFYLLVSLEMETLDPAPRVMSADRGVDLGQRYLRRWRRPSQWAQFYPGKQVRATDRSLCPTPEAVQRKGTRQPPGNRSRSAGRERRLKLNTNHCISRQIMDDPSPRPDRPGRPDGHPRSHETQARQERDPKQRTSQPACQPSGRFRGVTRASWSTRPLVAGSVCVNVDADYTSQACPRCGCTSRQNRPDHALLFVCQAATTRCMPIWWGRATSRSGRGVSGRTGWHTGQLSVAPDVTRAVKPKLHVSPDMQSCGGAQRQARLL